MDGNDVNMMVQVSKRDGSRFTQKDMLMAMMSFISSLINKGDEALDEMYNSGSADIIAGFEGFPIIIVKMVTEKELSRLRGGGASEEKTSTDTIPDSKEIMDAVRRFFKNNGGNADNDK
jgi:hypothetical protein